MLFFARAEYKYYWKWKPGSYFGESFSLQI